MRTIAKAIVENGRASEWWNSAVMLVFALTLSLPGDTLAAGSFDGLRRLGFQETPLAVMLTAIGMMRLVALYINGRWRRSPVLRGIGAMYGAVVFSMLGVAFAWPYLTAIGTEEQIALTTGAGTYLVLAGADVFSTYRSAKDYARSASH